MDKLYYLGIKYDLNTEFWEAPSILEVIVKPINKEIVYDTYVSINLKIIKIITKEILNKNEIDEIIRVRDLFKNIKNKMLMSKDPECLINDEGCLNCSGCYKSLFIEVGEYNNTITNFKKIELKDRIKTIKEEIELLVKELRESENEIKSLEDNENKYIE